MQPETDTDFVSVYRTSVGLLVVPKTRTKHAVSSAINGVLAQVVGLHDSLPSMATSDNGKARAALSDGRTRVASLLGEIESLRQRGEPIDVIQCVEVAHREMSGSLQKLAGRLRMYP